MLLLRRLCHSGRGPGAIPRTAEPLKPLERSASIGYVLQDKILCSFPRHYIGQEVSALRCQEKEPAGCRQSSAGQTSLYMHLGDSRPQGTAKSCGCCLNALFDETVQRYADIARESDAR